MGNILQLFNQMNPKKTTETRRKSRKKAPLRGPFLTFLAFEGAEPSVFSQLRHGLRITAQIDHFYSNTDGVLRLQPKKTMKTHPRNP